MNKYSSTIKWLKKNLKKKKSGLNGEQMADLCDDRGRNVIKFYYTSIN